MLWCSLAQHAVRNKTPQSCLTCRQYCSDASKAALAAAGVHQQLRVCIVCAEQGMAGSVYPLHPLLSMLPCHMVSNMQQRSNADNHHAHIYATLSSQATQWAEGFSNCSHTSKRSAVAQCNHPLSRLTCCTSTRCSPRSSWTPRLRSRSADTPWLIPQPPIASRVSCCSPVSASKPRSLNPLA